MRAHLKTDLKDSLQAGVLGGITGGVIWGVSEALIVLSRQPGLADVSLHFLATAVAMNGTIALMGSAFLGIALHPLFARENEGPPGIACRMALLWLFLFAGGFFFYAARGYLPSVRTAGVFAYLLFLLILAGTVFLLRMGIPLLTRFFVPVAGLIGSRLRTAFAVAMVLVLVASYADYITGRYFSSRSRAAGGDGPSVLLMVIDTVRADHMSLYGYERTTTPHLEDLAAGGYAFTRAFCQYPSSLGSHASLFTSLYPATHCTYEHVPSSRLPDELVTITECFEQAGHTTVGILDNPWLSRRFGFTQGFDVYVNAKKVEVMRVPDFSIMLENLYLKKVCAFFSEETEPQTRYALGVLRGLRSEKFFMFLHWLTPHRPYLPPAPYRAMFRDGRGGGSGVAGTQRTIFKLAKQNTIHIDEDLIPDIIRLYDADIAYTDRQVGIVLEEMRSLGIDRSTVVVVVSDHGENFTDELPYCVGHGGLTEGGIHVPLVLSYPPLGNGDSRVEEVVELIDVMPTLLELAGVDAPVKLQGRSLVPLLPGTPDDWREAAFVQLHGHEFAVRSRDWKLRIAENGDTGERSLSLFDVSGGGEEAVAAGEDTRAVIRRLTELFGAWRQEQGCLVEQEPAEEAEFDDETYQKLKSLGYLQ